MPLKFDIKVSDDYVTMRLAGAFDADDAVGLVWKAWGAGKNLDSNRVLIDARETTLHADSMAEILKVATEMAKVTQKGEGLRVANVVPADAERIRKAELLESTADMAGADYRFFTEIDQAVAWLTRGE